MSKQTRTTATSLKFKFTEKTIKAVELPEKAEVTYTDTYTQGLTLRVLASGQRTYMGRLWNARTQTTAAAAKKAAELKQTQGSVKPLHGTKKIGANFNALPFPLDQRALTTKLRKEFHTSARRVGADPAALKLLKETVAVLLEYADCAHKQAVDTLAAQKAAMAEQQAIEAQRAAIRAELVPAKAVTVSARADGSFVEINDRGEVERHFEDINRDQGVIAGLANAMLADGDPASTKLKILAFGREAALSGRTLMELSMTVSQSAIPNSEWRKDEADDFNAE